MKLSDLLKQYREKNNISQREFARRCDLSNSLISIIEMGKNPQTGKPMSQDMETYKKLADGMGITVQKLFEKLGDDAEVKLTPSPMSKPARELFAMGSMPSRIRAGVRYGIETKEKQIVEVSVDPKLATMMKLWKVASPKAKDATIEILKIMNEKEN